MMLSDLILFNKVDDIATAKAGDKICLTVSNYNGQGRDLVLMFSYTTAAELINDFSSMMPRGENVASGGPEIN
ncbi:MAG: hypothetical protein PHX83_12060 [Acidobacteriia bacterium]|nr:hypothetical protein [Terriglobia bacterium]